MRYRAWDPAYYPPLTADDDIRAIRREERFREQEINAGEWEYEQVEDE